MQRTHQQGVLAANIFDWGARACVELYRDGTILEIYRQVTCFLTCNHAQHTSTANCAAQPVTHTGFKT